MSQFPSHLIDPKKKDKKWISDFIKSIWRDFKGVYPSSFHNGRDRYHEIKLYMTGKQPTEKYKKVLICGAEKMSTIADYTDRNTCVLFGDGAGLVNRQAQDRQR